MFQIRYFLALLHSVNLSTLDPNLIINSSTNFNSSVKL